MQAEDLWDTFEGKWGVRFREKMKPKDLPTWFAPCFERIDGGQTPLRMSNGRMCYVTWYNYGGGDIRPADWPLGEGDVLLARPDGSVDIHIQDETRGRAFGIFCDRVKRKAAEERARRPPPNPTNMLRAMLSAMQGQPAYLLTEAPDWVFSETYGEGPYRERVQAEDEAMARRMVWC